MPETFHHLHRLNSQLRLNQPLIRRHIHTTAKNNNNNNTWGISAIFSARHNHAITPPHLPPLRLPQRVNPISPEKLMQHVGYPVRPRVLGHFPSLHSPPRTHNLGNLTRPAKSRAIISLDFNYSERQMHILLHSDDYSYGMRDPFPMDDEKCEPMYDWQTKQYPTCNILHELDLTSGSNPEYSENYHLLANGFWRDVWVVLDSLQQQRHVLNRLVLKTLRYRHDWEDRNFDRHRRDAVAMERLSWSENVLDIYGFCGNSGLFEFASGGSLDNIVFSSSSKLNSTEQLVIAYQVVAAIADMHDGANSDGEDNRTAIVHSDITTSQFVFSQGLYKLNDFNRCRFLAVDKETGGTCPFRVGNNPGTFRAPEEYAYQDESEKIDIYSMGNIFYSLLTGKWPFEDFKEVKDAQQLVLEGKRPLVDAKLLNTADDAVKAIISAMKACWHPNPRRRPSAIEIVHIFEQTLLGLGVKATAR